MVYGVLTLKGAQRCGQGSVEEVLVAVEVLVLEVVVAVGVLSVGVASV